MKFNNNKKWKELFKSFFCLDKIKLIKNNFPKFFNKEKKEVEKFVEGKESFREFGYNFGSIFGDFFVPSEANNYQPQILSSRRVFYHALGAVITKVVIVSFLFVYPATAWMTPDLAREESKKMIQLTNNIRQDLNLSILEENQLLDQSAYEKAKDMLAMQYFAHSNSSNRGLEYWIGNTGYSYSIAGENLSMGYATPENIIEAWQESSTHYKNMIDNLYKDIGIAMVSGPYDGIDTVFAVQHFARPKQSINTVPDNKIALQVNDKINSENITKIIETATIEITSTPDKNVNLVNVVAELPREVKSAVVNIKDDTLALEKQADNTWVGEKVITNKEEKRIVKPLVPATIAIETNAGKTETVNVAWKNIEPKVITRTEQYNIYKNHPTSKMNTILNIGSIYYKILLVITLLALFVSVFVEIRKQHPHLIIRSLGLVTLLFIFIIF